MGHPRGVVAKRPTPGTSYTIVLLKQGGRLLRLPSKDFQAICVSAEYGGVTLTPPNWSDMALSWAALRVLSAALGPLFVPLGRSSAALGPPRWAKNLNPEPR